MVIVLEQTLIWLSYSRDSLVVGKISTEKEEELEIVFDDRNFKPQEISEITEAFSKISPTKQLYFVRMSAVEVLPAVLIVSLGLAFGHIAKSFFQAMGSDIYQKIKEKVLHTLKSKDSPTLTFKMSYKDTEISITSKTDDEEKLNTVFDTIDKARDIAIKDLDKKSTPKMTEVVVLYDDGWKLDSGRNWNPPKAVKFYVYNEKTGKWELTRDWSQK